jgi:hypothetical protein
MDLPLCKICGTRHRLGWCPETGSDDPFLHRKKEPQHEKAKTPQSENHPVQTQTVEAKRGRPKKGASEGTLTATKPWEAMGISQRTWYRRHHGKAQ